MVYFRAISASDDNYTGNRRYELETLQTLDQFLSETEQRAYRMAVIATGNRDDALEIVQDAMFKLVNKYADKSAEDWGPLFHRILQSTIRDWYRRSAVRNRLRQFFFSTPESESADVMDEFEQKTVARPDENLKISQTMDALDEALHQLPFRQQQAFLLRQWHGLDVRQTAEVMGCSQGSVKTHLSRSIMALKLKLVDYQP